MTREEFSASSDVMWDMDKILEIHDNADHSELFYPMESENGTILAWSECTIFCTLCETDPYQNAIQAVVTTDDLFL